MPNTGIFNVKQLLLSTWLIHTMIDVENYRLLFVVFAQVGKQHICKQMECFLKMSCFHIDLSISLIFCLRMLFKVLECSLLMTCARSERTTR
jgi:hypothetical protein